MQTRIDTSEIDEEAEDPLEVYMNTVHMQMYLDLAQVCTSFSSPLSCLLIVYCASCCYLVISFTIYYLLLLMYYLQSAKTQPKGEVSVDSDDEFQEIQQVQDDTYVQPTTLPFCSPLSENILYIYIYM